MGRLSNRYQHVVVKSIVSKDDIEKLLQGQTIAGVEVVKTGPHRTVYRWNHPAGTLYVKHYKNVSWFARLRNAFRRNKASVERRHHQLLLERGIPTFDAVWSGYTQGSVLSRESFLVSREIEHSVPLKRYSLETLPHLPMHEQSCLRRRLAVALGKLAAKMHAAKIVHHDFHAGNILIRLGPDLTPTLLVIDLLKVHVARRRLSARQTERNLALLSMSLSRVATVADRVRLFRTFWQTLKAARNQESSDSKTIWGMSEREAARRFDRFTFRAKIEACKAEDKKWKRPNRKLIVVQGDNSVCWALAELERKTISKFQNRPQKLFSHENRSSTAASNQNARSLDVMLKIGRQKKRCVYTRLEPTPCYRWRWKLGQMAQWIAPRCQARETWRVGHALRRRGIDVPRPLLFVETFDGNDLQGFLLSETVEGTNTLSTALRQRLPLMKPADRQRWLNGYVKLLAQTICQLHWWRFEHRCLDIDAILVAEDARKCRLWFQKLEDVRQRWHISRRSIVTSLRMLNDGTMSLPVVQNTHRVRFLRRYLGDRFRGEWKSLWRKVQRQMGRQIESQTSSVTGTGAGSDGLAPRNEQGTRARKAG